jgi:hypothetical protein
MLRRSSVGSFIIGALFWPLILLGCRGDPLHQYFRQLERSGEKKINEHTLTTEDIAEYRENDYYMKFNVLFFLIKKYMKNGVKRKLFRNKNSRKAYLPIDGISKEIWKLEKIMGA